MPETPAPVFLLAGGRGSRREGGDPLMTRVLASCGVAHPTVAYVGAANGDSKPFSLAMSTYMRACGAGKVIQAPTVGKRARMDKTRAALESADMIFISGGDVEAGMKVLEERGILPLLGALYQAGKPFFGISAGTIMLGQRWVRWEDPDDDATAAPFPCMGFAPLICDTHSEGDDWVELRTLLRLSPEGTRGYGIPTAAALCAHADGRLEALGGPVACYVHRGGAVVREEDVLP